MQLNKETKLIHLIRNIFFYKLCTNRIYFSTNYVRIVYIFLQIIYESYIFFYKLYTNRIYFSTNYIRIVYIFLQIMYESYIFFYKLYTNRIYFSTNYVRIVYIFLQIIYESYIFFYKLYTNRIYFSTNYILIVYIFLQIMYESHIFFYKLCTNRIYYDVIFDYRSRNYFSFKLLGVISFLFKHHLLSGIRAGYVIESWSLVLRGPFTKLYFLNRVYFIAWFPERERLGATRIFGQAMHDFWFLYVSIWENDLVSFTYLVGSYFSLFNIFYLYLILKGFNFFLSSVFEQNLLLLLKPGVEAILSLMVIRNSITPFVLIILSEDNKQQGTHSHVHI